MFDDPFDKKMDYMFGEEAVKNVPEDLADLSKNKWTCIPASFFPC